MHVKGIHVKREDTVVLDGVSFDVEDGKVVALLGPSGVGKTTLLRVIAGLDRPERGTVTDDDGRPFGRSDIGVVFQDYPLLRHRTVEDNLMIATRIASLDHEAARERVRDLLAQVGLEDRAHHYPAQLSGGQRQRAAIAQQLVLPRRVLLLDEPFSGLDYEAIASVPDLIRSVAGTTVVLVTHDERAASEVSDLVVRLGGQDKRRGARVVSLKAA
jgi:ABC-type nitrate/sulfonate/bicarbonate transport system ATPase subunit